MRRAPSLFAVVAGILLSSSLAVAGHGASREQRAYEAAVQAFITSQRTADRDDSEIRWSRNLEILARSKSGAADRFLARIALFAMDGAYSEEYYCAATKRGRRLSRELRLQLARFKVGNVCEKTARAAGIRTDTLCATKETFARRVEVLQAIPAEDLEGACRY